MKKIKYLLPILTIGALVPTTTMVSCSKSDEVASEFDFSISTGGNSVMINGYANPQEEHDSHLIIPETVVIDKITYTVESIAERAFASALNIKNVTMPNSILSIGDSAFAGCKNLETIVLSSNLRSINKGLFSSCTALKEIFIPKGVQAIQPQAFADCPSLEKISVDPENERYYSAIDGQEQNCIMKHTSLGVELVFSIENIPDDVGIIDDYAFFGNNKITDITISKNITYIGESAFQACVKLESLTFDVESKLKIIMDSTFADCLSLKSVTCGDDESSLPTTLQTINAKAFMNTGIESISLDNGRLLYIGDQAFGFCNNLESIEIPATVRKLGCGAFSGCNNLTELKVDDNNEEYTSQNDSEQECNCILTIRKTSIVQGTKGIVLENLPTSITRINDYSFYGFNFTEFELPNTISYIGEYAFAECRFLENITLPDADGPDCTIASKAFSNDAHIETILIPKNIISINSTSFDGCSGLKEIVVDDDNEALSSSDNDDNPCHCVWRKINLELIQGSAGTKAIPEGIELIADNAFFDIDNDNFTEIVLPSSLEKIGKNAFTSCSHLSSFKFNGTVQEWKENVRRGEQWHNLCPTDSIYCIVDKTYAPLDPQ